MAFFFISVTTTASASAQPETVSSTQSSHPSASLSLSDGPATTDAALAALAAEAGLIDPPAKTHCSFLLV